MSNRQTTARDDVPPALHEPEKETGTLIEGLIVDGSRGQYRVETPEGAFACTIRGRLRKELTYAESTGARRGVRKVTVKPHDPVAVGDRVRVLRTDGAHGVIEAVVARAGGAFTRRDPDPKLDSSHGTLTTVAGLEQLVAVFAAREPEPHLGLLDRCLVVAEAQDIRALICVTKADLGIAPWLEARLRVYETLGYALVRTSVATGVGIAELRALLVGRTSALVGTSGVGKSSLLNALEPGYEQRVSGVSDATGKGRHTTTSTRLFPLRGPAGGYIADTAGIRALGLDRETARQLDACFPELRPYLGACRHTDCHHLREPGCAVRAAVTAGSVDGERYASYQRLRKESGTAAGAAWEAVV